MILLNISSPNSIKGLLLKRKVPHNSFLHRYPQIQRSKPKTHSIYTKNVHLSHEYGFHPSLRSHFKRSFVTQSSGMSSARPTEFQQNDFYEFENFNDYSQFGYNKMNFDAADFMWGAAPILFCSGLVFYVYGDKICSDDDLSDAAIIGS